MQTPTFRDARYGFSGLIGVARDGSRAAIGATHPTFLNDNANGTAGSPAQPEESGLAWASGNGEKNKREASPGE